VRRRLAAGEAERLVRRVRSNGGAAVRVLTADPGALPIAEQIRLVRGADVLVGVHGAGLSHVAWMRPGSCSLVEILPPREGVVPQMRGAARRQSASMWTRSRDHRVAVAAAPRTFRNLASWSGCGYAAVPGSSWTPGTAVGGRNEPMYGAMKLDGYEAGPGAARVLLDMDLVAEAVNGAVWQAMSSAGRRALGGTGQEVHLLRKLAGV